jgi:hypothetical protein
MQGTPGRVAGAITRVLHGLWPAALAALLLAVPSRPQEVGPRPPAEQCASIVSLDGRLVMQQWAPAGACARPVRTRVVDRFLGFTCLENLPRNGTCRAFAPPPGSVAFDTSRFFRCVDMAVTDTEAGIVVSRMREWAAPSKTCDWAGSLGVPAMEVDFARGEVCAGGLCIVADRLSVIGKLRLRRLIGTAFRDFGLGGSLQARLR